jgi:phosphohistidine phosphatase
MRLYLVQHGEAVPKDVDPDRPLSDRGAADIGRLASWLATTGTRVSGIVHSGKLRAQQTADILIPVLHPDGSVEARPGLAPNDPPEAYLETLADGDVIVVGHMPFVSRAVAVALGLPPDQTAVAFTPGSLAALERDDGGSWRLVAFVRPEHY